MFERFINQPDIVLDKIWSFLTVFEVQRLARLTKGMNRKISENCVWKNLLMRESPEYAVVSPMYAKRLLLSLHDVTLAINEFKVEFFFELSNFGKVIASGGPCTLQEGTEFSFEDATELFADYSRVPFERDIDTTYYYDYDFNLKISARYEGMIAHILDSGISNWDEDHWSSECGASVGDFNVEAWIILEEGEVTLKPHNNYGVHAASSPWLWFKHEDEDRDAKLNFSSYLEQLDWHEYKNDISEEDCRLENNGSDSSEEECSSENNGSDSSEEDCNSKNNG